MTHIDGTRVLVPDALRPFISLLFIECTNAREGLAFGKLTEFMRSARKSRPRSTCTAVASGFGDISSLLRSDPESYGVDEIDGSIYRVDSNPSWAKPGFAYMDTRYVLGIAMRRGRIFAVYCDPPLRDAIARWLKREPPPPFRRVSQNILQGAFLRGEAKGLWLHGTHVRSAILPDTKHITGRKLEDTLSPLEDSSFAMSAARSRLPDDEVRTALLGILGTVPRKGIVWNRQPEDFNQFLAASIEALELIEETITRGTALDRPFPILAVESHDLSGVYGAYDILTLTSDDLPTSSEVTDEMSEAAEVLQHATLKVVGSPGSADFKLEVGMNGFTGGVLHAAVRMNGDNVLFNFGYDYNTEPTDPASVRQVLNALENSDLFAVYYDSGHVVGPHGIGRRNINPAPFRNWQFLDFSEFDMTMEKPGRTPSEIHANIGMRGDKSLFGWVARHYSSGWLICDDGPGEVADFLHISPDGTLSLIHVKAAHSTSALRGISVSAYEVVTGQAAKNSRYLVDLNLLSDTLMISQGQRRAAWIDGKRVPDRAEFLAMLGGLVPSDKRQVVIVQPHVSEQMYRRIRPDSPTEEVSRKLDLLRLNSLETLLHTTRGAAVALSAELHVIGSKQ